MKNRNRMIVNCVTASLMYYWSLPALAEQSSSEIKIVRDEYGMPHIYANDTWHLFYGYGYVVAQDRLFQMEMARRSSQGTVAEVLGKDFVKLARIFAGSPSAAADLSGSPGTWRSARSGIYYPLPGQRPE